MVIKILVKTFCSCFVVYVVRGTRLPILLIHARASEHLIPDYSDSMRAIFGRSCGHHKLQFSVLKTAFSGMHVMSKREKIGIGYCE